MKFLLQLLINLFTKKKPTQITLVENPNLLQNLDLKKYMQLRNQILRCYLEFNSEMIKANGKQMDEIAAFWSGTTTEVTKVLQLAFSQGKDEDIKESLKLFEVEIRKVIDSLPFDDGNGNSGINYNGPKGEA